jgi:glycosyltransferase involved in cell wall biosynthesis
MATNASSTNSLHPLSPVESESGLDLSLVIPVFNSAGTLPTLIHDLHLFFEQANFQGEIILVNDGSRDNSWEVAQQLATTHPRITAINLTKNFGQHTALLIGLRQAVGPVIITMDDDLQHPPSEIPKLLTQITAGFDVVYGVPEKESHGWWRDFCSVVGKKSLQWVLGIQRAEDTSAFRAINSQVLTPFHHYENYHVDIDAILAWVTDRFASVRVQHLERRYGTSNYTFFKLLRHTLKMILSFTTIPLRLASIIGFAFTAFGFLLLVYVLLMYTFYSSAIPGFAFLASAISILSGAQLFSLGLLGEYLAKMHFRIMGRPGGVIRSVVTRSTRTP